MIALQTRARTHKRERSRVCSRVQKHQEPRRRHQRNSASSPIPVTILPKWTLESDFFHFVSQHTHTNTLANMCIEGEKNVDAENIQERDAAHAFPVKRRQTKFENKKKKKREKIYVHTQAIVVVYKQNNNNSSSNISRAAMAVAAIEKTVAIVRFVSNIICVCVVDMREQQR